MRSSRLTRFGLLVALLGWGVLLFGGPLWRLAGLAVGHPLAVDLGASSTEIGQMLIVSGFGLAILGALRAGVATLQQFFEAVLQRAAAAKAQPAPPMPEPDDVDPDAIVERGRIMNRPFARFADGSVEVETLLGMRRFASLAEAREFIGS